MLSSHLRFLLLALLLTFVAAAKKLTTTVTEGPEECDELDKIKKGKFVQMHYVGSIDETSETGEKGSIFDSSDKRGKTFDFTVGQGQVIKVRVVVLVTSPSTLSRLFFLHFAPYAIRDGTMDCWGCAKELKRSWSFPPFWDTGTGEQEVASFQVVPLFGSRWKWWMFPKKKD